MLVDWQVLHEQGKTPTVEQFCAACPELASAMRSRIAALEFVQRFYIPESDADSWSNDKPSTAPTLGIQTPTPHSSPLAPKGGGEGETISVSLPGYEVLEVLGRGGMGVVYKARQLGFKRIVALKMVIGGSHARAEVLSRFLAEAELIARLHHRHIVQVYDFGTHEGLPFYSMEYLSGGSVAARVRGEPQPSRWSAELVQQLAEAMHAAHLANIVHRDLKPANVLLESDGSPRITDFGLAKWTEHPDLTATGAVMGTPSYMAPEQAAGRTDAIGPAADIWALGAILYDLLTGRPPFKGASTTETLEQVRQREPAPIRLLQPNCPRDLQTICHKCLQKDVQKRYPSAAELADDLRRFLAGEPIHARPVGLAERGWRWCRRNRPLVALYGVVALAACVLLGMALWFSAQMGAAHADREIIKSREAAAQAKALAAEKVAEAQRFVSQVNQARARIARPRPGWTWAALDDLARAARSAPSAATKDELRADAAECLTSLDVRLVRPLNEGLSASSIAWSPDGKRLAIGHRAVNVFAPRCDITLAPLDPTDKSHTVQVPANRTTGGVGLTVDLVSIIAFSTDGRWLAAGMRSGWLHRIDLTQPETAPQSQLAHDRIVTGLAFSNDGRSLYSSGGMTVRRWDAATGESLATFTATQPTRTLALHPHDGWLAVAAGQSLRLGPTDLQPLAPPLNIDGRFTVFTPDGLCLLDGREGRVRAWHLVGNDWAWEVPENGKPTGERVEDACCGAGGALLLMVCSSRQDTRARLFDLVNNRLVAELPAGGAEKVALAPDGRHLALTSEKQVRLYEIGGRAAHSYAAVSDVVVQSFCISADGRTLATDGRNLVSGVSRLTNWNLSDDLCRQEGCRHVGATTGWLHLSLTRCNVLAAGATEERLAFWDLPDGAERPGAAVSELRQLDHDSAGRLWAAAGEQVLVWDEAGRRLGTHTHLGGLATALTGNPGVMSIAPGRDRAVAGCRNGSLLVLELRSDGLQLLAGNLLSRSEVSAVAVSPDDRLAVAGARDGELIVVALPEGTKCFAVPGHEDGVAAVRAAILPPPLPLSPRGRGVRGEGLWASGDRLGIVKLWRWDGRALREVLTLRHSRPVRDLRLHAETSQLFVLLDGERAVRIYHLDRLRQRLKQMGLDMEPGF